MSIDLGVFVWNYIPQCVGYTSMSVFVCVCLSVCCLSVHMKIRDAI